MSIDWGSVWVFVKPILREALIALLMAVLALLGYDKIVPSRFIRNGGGEEMARLIAEAKLRPQEVSRRHGAKGV